MTTKVEPTVEKWEESKIDYSQSFTLGLNKDNTEMITITPKSSETMQASMSFRQLHRILSQVRSHSVQEAKAEERQAMITKLHNVRSKIHGYISLTELTDLLSTLNTKASLKQEEEK